MATEIERKFLLQGEAWRQDVERSVPMRQAYLGGDGVSVRIRIAGDEAWLNIKEARLGMARAEFEYTVPLSDARDLERLARGGRVEKTRHYLRHGGCLWEIDEFEGANRGLVVAEIELDRPEQPFPRPGWLGREVTGDEAYYNLQLARRPYSQWARR